MKTSVRPPLKSGLPERSGGFARIAAAFLSGVAAALIIAGAAWWGWGETKNDNKFSRSSVEAGFPSGFGGSIAHLISSALAVQVQADLGEGDYLFLPNRRTIWVVNRTHGRFANYHFREDEENTILRSRVVTIDRRDFPPEDTLYLLSDRNLTELLWVCNKRTGDVQLWQPRVDGNVVSSGQIVTSVDLAPKTETSSSK